MGQGMAMVMALYAVAERIEARAVGRARHAIAALLALAPVQARVRQADGRWQDVAVAAVAVGAIVRVRPGERVPLDGVVTEGSSARSEEHTSELQSPKDLVCRLL